MGFGDMDDEALQVEMKASIENRGLGLGDQRMQPTLVVKEEEMFRLFCQDLTLEEVASAMGLAKSTVRRYCRRSGFQARLRQFSATLFENVDKQLSRKYDDAMASRLDEAAEEALEEMMQLSKHGGSESVRLKASQDLLDRHAATSRIKQKQEDPGRALQINIAVLQSAAQTVKEEQEWRLRQQQLIDLPPASKQLL